MGRAKWAWKLTPRSPASLQMPLPWLPSLGETLSRNHSATLLLASRPARKAERRLVVLNCGRTGSPLCPGAQMDLGI